MPTEISQSIDAIRSLLAQVPGALLAIVFLAGPTAVWIAYRFLNAKPHSRLAEEDGKALWICKNCRSASDLGRSRCYRCGFERGDLETVEFVAPPAAGSGGTDPRIAFPGIGVGPGPSLPLPTGLGPGGPVMIASSAPGGPDAAALERSPVPVGPGKPPVTVPRRYVVADRPVPVAMPDDAAVEEDGGPDRTTVGAGSERTSAGVAGQR